MATINSAIKLEDKMTQTFKNISKAGEQANKTFNNIDINVKHIDERMKAANKTSSSFFSGLLKFNIFSGVFSMITSQLDSAISRFDTLQNYTRVMANLGIAEEEANASRERLKQGLQGLPTTLDSAALAVQRFASANNNVEASTEMYLAMNNALLAGGASIDIQKSAMEQLAQAYAKGKPDMMEWRALQQAMPGQLQQIAKAMGKTTTELGEDLRSGKTSMNEFMKTAIQLNQEGIDGFASFAEQAENSTKGIQTAIANMQSAIARGWEGMIEKANTALEASGLPTIEEIIKNVGLTIEETMNRLGEEAIPTLVSAMADLGSTFDQIDQDFGEMTNHAIQGLTILDFFQIGLKAVVLGIDVVYNSIKVFCIAAKYAFLDVGSSLYNTVYDIVTGAQGLIQDAAHKVQDFLNGIIRGLNSLGDAFSKTFSFIHTNVRKIEELTFADSLDSAIAKANSMAGLDEGWKAKLNEAADNAWAELEEASTRNTNTWNKQATDIQNLVSKLKDAAEATQVTAVERAGRYDYNQIDNLSNNINAATGQDSTGGKAIKTTTNDDLLKDEDIQLLLDVATRDYKLNYQQVTPNITLTFGDIRETADVDKILDEVADRLEEIYDSNLEVAPV